MKYCKYCNSQIDDDALFCTSCGARLDEAKEGDSPLVSTQNNEPKANQIFAYVGFGAGLTSFTISFIPMLNSLFGIEIGIAAIVFSILGKKAKSKSKFAKIGLIFGILGIVFSIIFTVVYALQGVYYSQEEIGDFYEDEFYF